MLLTWIRVRRLLICAGIADVDQGPGVLFIYMGLLTWIKVRELLICAGAADMYQVPRAFLIYADAVDVD